MDSKDCKKCGEVKLLTEFYKRKDGHKGRSSWCKSCKSDHNKMKLKEFRKHTPCKVRIRKKLSPEEVAVRDRKQAEYRRNYYASKGEEIRGKARLRWQEDDEYRELRKRQKKAWGELNKDYVREKYVENRNEILAKQRAYWSRNRDRKNSEKRADRAANPSKYREVNRKWRKRNPGKARAIKVRRELAKIQRTPGWACGDTIALYYETRKALSDATGIVYHVDHIYPLRGATVSGLHVPDNLQIISKKANLSKSASQGIDY